MEPLLTATSFVGSVPTPIGPTPADATITYGKDTITLSLHVVDPRPFYSDFKITNRPESICIGGDQFYFLDGANRKKVAFKISGNSLIIQKDDHVLTMHPADGDSGAGTSAGQRSKVQQ